MAEEDLNGTGTPFSLSFSGSGFLALYQIGVVQSLLELAPEILKSASKVYGASAGSLIAAAVVCESSLEDLKESFHEAVRDARKTILGPLSPGCNTLRTIQKGLYKMLPENSHQVASGRLHISLTRVTDGQNVMVSEFSSKEDLIQALICSCFVPIYCGFIPPSFRGVRYVDGGFTNLQPCSDLEAVITVSPFTGELDICPRDCPAIFYSFQIFNSSIQISVENLCRISYALFPPSYLVLNEFFSRGYQDAVLFLHRNNAFGINYPANTVTFRFASLLSKNDLSRANEESSCRNPDTGGLESNGPAPRDLPPKQAAAVSGTLNGTDQKIQPQLPPRQHKAARERQKASGLLDSVAEIISQCLMSYKLPTKMMFSLSKRIEQLWALLDEMCWMAQQFKRTGRLVRNTAAGLSNGVVSESHRITSRGVQLHEVLNINNEITQKGEIQPVVMASSVCWYNRSSRKSSSGFLINYQVGVVQALWELAPEILRSASKVYGSSCGAIVAAAVACEVDVGLIEEFFHEAMEEARKASILTLCPGYRMLRMIEKGLRKELPENSHQLASGKVCISLTRLLDLQNVIISEYRSKEELIQAVICSCFLPVYCGFNPPSFQGVRYIDGGMTNVQPGSDSDSMITVSPYTGEVDICPRDCPAYFNCISFFRSTFQLSVENLCRFSYSIFPPSPPVLREFYLQGYHDAIFFLQRHRENGTVNGTDKKIPQQMPVRCDKAVALPAPKSQKTPGSLGSAAEITSQHLVPCKLHMDTSLPLTDR